MSIVDTTTTTTTTTTTPSTTETETAGAATTASAAPAPAPAPAPPVLEAVPAVAVPAPAVANVKLSWNEYQKMNKGRSCNTTDWRKYNESRMAVQAQAQAQPTSTSTSTSTSTPLPLPIPTRTSSVSDLRCPPPAALRARLFLILNAMNNQRQAPRIPTVKLSLSGDGTTKKEGGDSLTPESLLAFYAKYQPDKANLSKVKEVLKKYDHKALCNALQKKYGAAPATKSKSKSAGGDDKTAGSTAMNLQYGSTSTSTSTAVKKAWRKGDKVEGNFSEQGTWYKGTITLVRPDMTYDITYDDGDFEEEVPGTDIREVTKEPDFSASYIPGMGVGGDGDGGMMTVTSSYFGKGLGMGSLELPGPEMYAPYDYGYKYYAKKMKADAGTNANADANKNENSSSSSSDGGGEQEQERDWLHILNTELEHQRRDRGIGVSADENGNGNGNETSKEREIRFAHKALESRSKEGVACADHWCTGKWRILARHERKILSQQRKLVSTKCQVPSTISPRRSCVCVCVCVVYSYSCTLSFVAEKVAA